MLEHNVVLISTKCGKTSFVSIINGMNNFNSLIECDGVFSVRDSSLQCIIIINIYKLLLNISHEMDAEVQLMRKHFFLVILNFIFALLELNKLANIVDAELFMFFVGIWSNKEWQIFDKFCFGFSLNQLMMLANIGF